MARFNTKAITIGVLVDQIGSLVGGFLIAFISLVIVSIVLNNSGAWAGEGLEQTKKAIMRSPWMLIFTVVFGFFFNALGGYIAARIARFSELKHAITVGVVSLIITIAIFVAMSSAFPIWVAVISWILMVPAAFLGGFLRLKTKRATAEPDKF